MVGHLVGVQVRFGIILDLVMRFELFSEHSVGVEWCVRKYCNVFQPHRVVLSLQPHSIRILTLTLPMGYRTFMKFTA